MRAGATVVGWPSRWRVFELGGWRCHICSQPIDPTLCDHADPMVGTLDHVVPLALHGAHDEANLAPAHAMCNSLKGIEEAGSPY